MKAPSHEDAYQVLLLQAADEGRADKLFGDSFARARASALPFMIGEEFPDVYLEHPLAGDPFLDVTVLLRQLNPGDRVDSPAAGDHGAVLDWYAAVRGSNEDVACGFELDTKDAALPQAALHFQPRRHTELVRPFCEAIGEPERADLYLDLGARMPEGWPLSFFGLFRGRPGAPLRVCGYLGEDEPARCVTDPARLAAVFDEVGFTAFDDAMLEQVRALMDAAPGTVDFQFDVFPDGSIGPVFAIDVQFGIEQPESVQKTFREGPGARVMGTLQEWGAADDRWKAAVQSAFARALPVEDADGEMRRYCFTLMPQWAKARWAGGALQPAKLYHHAYAGILADT